MKAPKHDELEVATTKNARSSTLGEGGKAEGAGCGTAMLQPRTRASTTPLQVGERVFIHGLTSEAGRKLNLKPARVVPETAGGQVRDGRVPVLLLVEEANARASKKLIRRTSLLRASIIEDRQ